jgi:hypothetical protein
MTTIDSNTQTAPRRRPSFGRPLSKRGFDLFDTPPEALNPLFAHEPLLWDVTHLDERFAGKGNLVLTMRSWGITVYASDILDRGCPGATVRDFFQLKRPGRNSRVLLSNPPYARAMEAIEHAFAIGYDVVIFLLKTTFLHTDERYERLHTPGHLCRVHVLAERLQGMHDANHIAAGGKESGQSQSHSWFVLDRNHYGPAVINPVALYAPSTCMPWSAP